MKKLATTCIAILTLVDLANAQPAPISAKEIMDRMAAVYASCRTYTDEGEVSAEFVDRSSPTPQHFFTAFARPSSFRFELRFRRGFRDEARYVAWKEGDLEKSGWPSPPYEREAPLERTLLNLARPSRGSAVTIPGLLLPDLFRTMSLLTSLEELKLAGEEKIDGRQTFRIEGKLQGQMLKLWIDRNEFLIVKTYRKVNLGGFEEETTTKYKPKVNVEISNDKLVFNPPSESRSAQASTPNFGPSSSLPVNGTNLAPLMSEAPRLRDFGSSLRRNSKENAERRRKKRSNVNEEDVVRVDTDLVVCDVLVVDKEGKSIPGLVEEDFVVKEDDVPQKVGSFSRGDSKTIPRSIVLLIDYSGSQLPYIKTSIEAAKTLVDQLNPEDRMAIVTDDVQLLVDFTSDKEILKAKLESLKTNALSGKLGRSEQYDALIATLNELFNEEDLRPIVIFQTDGDRLNDLTGDTPSNPYLPKRKYTFEDLLTAAEKARGTVYSIIPGIRLVGLSEDEQLKKAKLDWKNRDEAAVELRRLNNLPARNSGSTSMSDTSLSRYLAHWLRMQLALTGLAKYTGGWVDFLEQPDQANEVYKRILTDINQRYIIGYYPTNRTRDGRRRKVSIEVRGHPEYVVWGRKTYFAPE